MNHEIYLPIIPQLPVSPIKASLRLRKRHACPASEIPAQGRPVAESVLFHEYLEAVSALRSRNFIAMMTKSDNKQSRSTRTDTEKQRCSDTTGVFPGNTVTGNPGNFVTFVPIFLSVLPNA
ncbi:MAG TPA: hypothetical protein H9866_06375 [Candidatus Tidjanibacter gallistercoris]|nr:hypothetical protein [Candidatus Tidjanibacter gallistercoris]